MRSFRKPAPRGATIRLAAGALAAGLLAAACTSDGKPDADTTGTPATTASWKSNVGRPLQISTPLPGQPCRTRDDATPVVTGSCVDPKLNQPYVDKDERRTVTDPETKVKVDFRYVHGGFSGTEATFAFYFPDRYAGRFFQYTYPTLTTDDAGPATIAFALSNGAYLVRTNNAGGLPKAGELGGYRANAAAANLSRTVAAQVYADSARPRGYIYGASGGAYQTIGALENTEGVWDGGVPIVPGTPNAIPSSMTTQLLALRVLRDKFPQIVDAMEPGGSGDPYAGLNTEQQAVLREATRLGFSPRGWWDHAEMDGGAFYAVAGGVRILDPTYVDDFWSKPGYAGTDPASSAGAARFQYDAEVTELVGSPPTGLRLSGVPAGDLTGADIVVTSGAAAGKSVIAAGSKGTEVTFRKDADAATTAAIGTIRPGDHVRLDNSWLLALQYYQRYQVPSADMYGWNQFRGSDGAPLYPQRPVLAGPTFAQAASGAVPTGKFHGKMIMLASLLDVEAFPWPADWYRTQAQTTLGAELNDSYRLWYMDNAVHSSPRDDAAETHVVSYGGEAQQALLDLDAWVTQGTAPPASSSYTVDSDSQVNLAPTAEQRKGVQPVVNLTISKVGTRDVRPAAVRADARPDEAVTLAVSAQAPPGSGKIVRVEWDFDGRGTYPDQSEIDNPGSTVQTSISHAFTRPGTYFAVVRVTSERNGDAAAPYTLVQNIARARVIVR
ncbi:hypothetical protein CcI49_12010 [Frankia sp. CcI49]|uniref:PKD domain-containing protein n=1 Tax=Frankia sp. CcI49 TaxID=1745382 RepID=UPI0009772D16|nr:PKD domain-containing protein [Frankia sp. CcI49]ONH60127.1 hypothetical protein CcI49_12010 [Frankia sp. CcI49]